MGKKAKTSEGELLTIGVKKPKVLEQEKQSIFTQPSTIERTIQVNQPANPNQPTNGIEEKVILNETPIVEEKVIPIVPATIVYEITYEKNSLEQVVYTKSLPVIIEKHILNLVNAFGRSNLREVVLGKKEIKISCILPLESTDLTIDMRGGLLIKVVSEDDWMTREYTDTKKLFDDAVLKAYREMAEKINITKEVPGVVQTKRPRPVQQQEEQEEFPTGNIPVNRGIINF